MRHEPAHTKARPPASTIAARLQGNYTEKEAAEKLGFDPRTLQNWRQRGIGPPYLKLGHAVRYRVEDLDAYEAKNLRLADEAA